MNQERKPEVYRGYLDECLRHLGSNITSKTPQAASAARDIKEAMAKFCGVTLDTVSRWLHATRHPPVGLVLIRLMNYLDLMGYRVLELEKSSTAIRNFSELLAFNLLTNEQAVKVTGYTQPSALYQVLLSKYGVSDERKQKMWETWKECKDQLAKKKEEERVKVPPLPYQATSHPAVIPPSPKARPLSSSRRSTAITSIMNGLLSLLQDVPLQTLPADMLVELRQSADTVSNLLVHLSTLNSRLTEKKREGGG